MSPSLWVIGPASILAVGIPFTLIYLRRAVRNDRTAVITELENIFKLSKENPSFEFLKYKYEISYNKITSAQLAASALPFILLLFIGICFILTPISQFSDVEVNKGTSPLSPIMLLGTERSASERSTTEPKIAPCPDAAKPEPANPCPQAAQSVEQNHSHARFRNGLTMLALVFAGSMLFALSYLLNAVMTFELGPLSFLKMTLHILAAQIVAVVVWRLSAEVPLFGSDANQAFTLAMLAPLAFWIGYVPDLGLRYLATRISLPFKASRDDLLSSPRVRSTPLEVIDGIDATTCFRLKDSMLMDVQHLATTNPLALYVETPYGLYQSIDWVAQAQLCTIVGPDTFIALRERNVRTIFDFEQATAATSTPHVRREIGLITFPTRHQSGAPSELTDDDLRRLFDTMLDDLHVHRLRQLWNAIKDKLQTTDEAGKSTEEPPEGRRGR